MGFISGRQQGSGMEILDSFAYSIYLVIVILHFPRPDRMKDYARLAAGRLNIYN